MKNTTKAETSIDVLTAEWRGKMKESVNLKMQKKLTSLNNREKMHCTINEESPRDVWDNF